MQSQCHVPPQGNQSHLGVLSPVSLLVSPTRCVVRWWDPGQAVCKEDGTGQAESWGQEEQGQAGLEVTGRRVGVLTSL